MAGWRLDRMRVLGRLESVDPGEDRSTEDAEWLRRMRLSANLMALAEIDHEREYALCKAIEEQAGQGSTRL
jgi:hypothetical protein